MFGHEKLMMNGNGSLSTAGVVGVNTQATLPSPPVLTTSVTTSASTSSVSAAAIAAAVSAVTTPVGASNSSAPAGISNGMNGTNQNANNHRGLDSNKRRKSKSRNTTVPNTSTYSREHLNAWLETCLKDASSTQLSSSSEFLDYNPSKSFQSNKKPPMHQQQPQQQHQQNQFKQQFHQQFKQQQQKQQFQQLFDLPRPPSYSNAFNPAFQMNNPYAFNPINHLLQHTDGSVEFASLPPIVNILGSENENNSTDVLDGSSSNPNMSRGFSDPCLLNPSDNDSKVSGQNTPDRRNYPNQGGDMDNNNNKFFAALMEQINMLHETNSKICRNLHETKVEIEALKHAPNWGLRHRRDSLSGLSTHSQPLGFGFGTQSPAPTYHSGAYTPGMMTDVVREVKESARVREDALLSRVKSMVEERSWSMGEENLRMLRDIEDLKSQVQNLKADSKETNKRMVRLETDNKYMRQMLATILNKRIPDIIYDKDAPRPTGPRKSFPDMRQPKRANSLNLHYGVIHQATEEEEPMNSLHIAEQGTVGVNSLNSMESSDQRHSFSSSDGQTSIVNSTTKNNGWPEERSSIKRVPKQQQQQPAAVVGKDTLELQKELQEAIAARKQADNRIIALENMVKKLQVKFPNGGDEQMIATTPGGSKNGGGNGCNTSAAAPAYSSFLLSSTSSSSPAPKSNSATNTAPTTALVSSSASQIFQLNSSNQMQLQQQQQYQQQQQHLQQQQQQNNHLPPKLSLAGPITDL
ncbi:GATA zinc finger domain-containing protein 10 isoform X2 [Episyrphus balteatus]|uniref:GATA zinc finger domain-containing protein 10 isoform X2 n=1 Tax=Episyrphus balteatus TaxID=286459 RepID=UPI0024855729|nr:GATA zinc finger domain-containing protein 10 isoform X2 [Episyrphus balteatus]